MKKVRAWGLPKESSKWAICKQVVDYYDHSALDGEDGAELFLTMLGRKHPSLSLSVGTTSEEILGADSVKLFPKPALTIDQQGGQNVEVKRGSPTSSSVLKFHRLAGLQVGPGAKPAFDPPPLLQLDEQQGQKEEKSPNCRYWMHSPHSYLK